MTTELFMVVGSFQWSEIEEFELDEYEDELQRRLQNMSVNDCCSLVYTVSLRECCNLVESFCDKIRSQSIS